MNITKAILFLLMIGYGLNTFAQCSVFEYISDTPEDELLLDLVEDESHNVYLSVLMVTQPNGSNYYARIEKLNSSGTLIAKKEIKVSGKENLGENIFHNEDTVALVGSFYDKGNDYKSAGISIFRLNSSLSLIDSIFYYLPDTNSSRYGIYTNKQIDGTYLIGGSSRIMSNAFQSPFIYHLNTNFDSIKAKHLTHPSESGVLKYLRLVGNQNYWGINMLKFAFQLFDSSFNLLSTQKFPAGFSGGNTSADWESDTSFYIIGSNHYPFPDNNLCVIKQYDPIDTSNFKKLVWHQSDTVDFPAPWKGIDLKNQDTLFFGGTRNLNIYNPYFSSQPSWFIVVQTDSALNVRWERFYGGDAYYVMTNVLASRDGGCFVGGVRYDYQNNTEQQRDVVLLKLNSEGLLVGVNSQKSIRMHEAIVYPNPGKDEMHLRIAAQHPFSVLTLYDLRGRQVLQQSINGQEAVIRTTGLAPGTYIYELSAPTGLYETGKWVKQ